MSTPEIPPADDRHHDDDDRSRTWLVRAVLAVLAALVSIVLVGVIVLFAFSVHVDGHSMEPTLQDRDRLFANLFGGEVERFDLLELDHEGTPIVKRVIGLPGDTVWIDTRSDDDAPRVFVRPAGSTTTYRVESSAWPQQWNGEPQQCCRANGMAIRGPDEQEGTDGGKVTVPADSYWVMGDNYSGSDDSRVFGFFTRDHVHATLNLRIQPLAEFGFLPEVARLVPAG